MPASLILMHLFPLLRMFLRQAVKVEFLLSVLLFFAKYTYLHLREMPDLHPAAVWERDDSVMSESFPGDVTVCFGRDL